MSVSGSHRRMPATPFASVANSRPSLGSDSSFTEWNRPAQSAESPSLATGLAPASKYLEQLFGGLF